MKILTLDIETSPHISMHFGRRNQFIIPEHTLFESRVICWSAKWAGSKKMYFRAEWQPGGRKRMLDEVWQLIDEADVIVHFNGKSFDMRRLNAEFIVDGYEAPSPYQQVDLMRVCQKNFGFSSHRLKHVLERLGLSPKLEENTKMELWRDVCWFKLPEARTRMMKYNKQDVRSTEELYYYILGWIDNHPNWGLYVDDVRDPNNPVCPNCGQRHLVRHKVRRTRVRVYRQWYCKGCGKYSRGRKHIGAKGTDNGVIT